MGNAPNLSSEQRRALDRLSNLPKISEFYLAGAALGVHLGHRRSADLDFFSRTPSADLDAIKRDAADAADAADAVTAIPTDPRAVAEISARRCESSSDVGRTIGRSGGGSLARAATGASAGAGGASVAGSGSGGGWGSVFGASVTSIARLSSTVRSRRRRWLLLLRRRRIRSSEAIRKTSLK